MSEETKRKTPADNIDELMENSFQLVQRLLILGVAIALVILAGMALWDTIVLVHVQLDAHDVTKAITVGVDTVFLTVILLELLHTVVARESLARQAPDFIVIGITAGIRHGLGLVATSGGSAETVTRIIKGKAYHVSVPGAVDPLKIVESLAINALGVLLLVGALWVVRQTYSSKPLTK